MPTGAASTADEIADSIRSLVDRVADTKLTQEVAKRGQDVAEVIAERGAVVGDRASDVWRDTQPLRRDAVKRATRVTGDAASWSDKTWRTSIRPALRDLWKRRTLAIGAAGAAVPASRELVDSAAVRLGLRQREERHWGAFFLGLVIGAAGGAIVALLTAPKRGSEIRQELSARADEVRSEISARARDAEWVPVFQRDEPTNGNVSDVDASGSVQEAAADAGSATGAAADHAATDTAEAINESYDGVDRESQI
ncbi:MAG: YtxH domain-containing protein [Chloroflexi bacterium]|nr:YtxH domain-containing protein [Chloroflexota bacterium]